MLTTQHEQASADAHQRWQLQKCLQPQKKLQQKLQHFLLKLQAYLQRSVELQALRFQQALPWRLVGSFWQPQQVQHVHAPSSPHALRTPSSTGKLTDHRLCCLQQIHVQLVSIATAACNNCHSVSSETDLH